MRLKNFNSDETDIICGSEFHSLPDGILINFQTFPREGDHWRFASFSPQFLDMEETFTPTFSMLFSTTHRAISRSIIHQHRFRG